jgi:hypothetical protein
LPLELGLDAHPSQHLNTVLVCDPHYANKIIPARRANDNVAGPYLALITHEPVKLSNPIDLANTENRGHAAPPLS